MSPAPVSVVLPMYNTRAHVPELLDRLDSSCPAGTELVCVDDGCPERSLDAVRAWAADRCRPVRLIEVDPGVGQHAAVLIGLAHATGPATVVMDADLQDAPEDVIVLVDVLRSAREDGIHVVASGRRGSYESSGRQRTARLYRRVLALLSRGRVPPDAGMFCAMSARAREQILGLGDPVVPLIAAAARAGFRVQTVPLERQRRDGGRSSTASSVRARVAWRGLTTLSAFYPVARALRRRRWHPPLVVATDLAHPTDLSPTRPVEHRR